MARTSGLDGPILTGLAALTVLVALAPARAAAQNAVAVVSASGYANFHAGGVLLTVSGDANANAAAALEWRSVGGTFLPAQPLERIDPTHFAGSLFDLAPSTFYEARVTLTDPDGVAGSPVTAAFSTRSETSPPTLRTLLSPDGTTATRHEPRGPAADRPAGGEPRAGGGPGSVQPGVYRESGASALGQQPSPSSSAAASARS
jgi:hypothetical protein